jgi:hypothetical protein
MRFGGQDRRREESEIDLERGVLYNLTKNETYACSRYRPYPDPHAAGGLVPHLKKRPGDN